MENWNTAFEAAGWVDAIRVLDLPEDADPNDIRYSVLRWNTSDDPGYTAIGPSKVDPRTGEILDADILFEANGFRSFRNTWRNIVNPMTAAEAFEMALGVGEFQALDPNVPRLELPGFESALESQGALAGLVLAARDEMEPGDPLPNELLRQYTMWIVMHEVGHTLGLRHNFRSSASTPMDQLHNTAFTGANGVYGSVMEYPTVNLAPPGRPSATTIRTTQARTIGGRSLTHTRGARTMRTTSRAGSPTSGICTAPNQTSGERWILPSACMIWARTLSRGVPSAPR